MVRCWVLQKATTCQIGGWKATGCQWYMGFDMRADRLGGTEVACATPRSVCRANGQDRIVLMWAPMRNELVTMDICRINPRSRATLCLYDDLHMAARFLA